MKQNSVAPTPSVGGASTSIRPEGWVALLIILGLWSIVFNVAGRFTWGWGPLSFLVYLSGAFLLAFVQPLALRLERAVAGRVRFQRSHIEVLAGTILIAYIGLDLLAFVQEIQIPRNSTYLIDIAANTYEAGQWFFRDGVNPYTHFSQVWDHLTPDIPHVTLEGNRVYLYGVRYYYGFPYFPMMFISFEPFRRLVEGYNAFRVGNLFFYGVSLTLIIGLCRCFVRRGYQRPTALLCMLAFLSVRVWSNELFHEGVVDIIISVYGLAGFLMLAYRKPVLSGICFGLAFGCKLLPAPFWFMLVTLWWWRNEGVARAALFAGVFALISGAVILPFVAWDPGAFFSATILYFLTSQGAGDNSSLWYFLPGVLKPVLLLAGGLGIGGLFVRFFLKKSPSVEDTMKYAFLTYTVFIAFNKQTHLNHLWSVFTMGSVVLIVLALQALDPDARPTESNRNG